MKKGGLRSPPKQMPQPAFALTGAKSSAGAPERGADIQAECSAGVNDLSTWGHKLDYDSPESIVHAGFDDVFIFRD
jgi:hypothetical protein